MSWCTLLDKSVMIERGCNLEKACGVLLIKNLVKQVTNQTKSSGLYYQQSHRKHCTPNITCLIASATPCSCTILYFHHFIIVPFLVSFSAHPLGLSFRMHYGSFTYIHTSRITAQVCWAYLITLCFCVVYLLLQLQFTTTLLVDQEG